MTENYSGMRGSVSKANVRMGVRSEILSFSGSHQSWSIASSKSKMEAADIVASHSEALPWVSMVDSSGGIRGNTISNSRSLARYP